MLHENRQDHFLKSEPSDSISRVDSDIRFQKSPRYSTVMLIQQVGGKVMGRRNCNITSGRFFIPQSGELEAGARLEMVFRLPGSGLWMRGRGVICKSIDNKDNEYACGRFTEIEPGNKRFLATWFYERLGLEAN